MSKLRKLYKRIRYWRQIKQGFGLLEEYGTKVELTRVTDLVATDQDTNTDVSNPQSKATLKKGGK